jgi:uncharacterized protein with von Willebrand factor type A (vWA) domain
MKRRILIVKKIILFFLILFVNNFNNKTQAQGCLTADVMILIDWSGSEYGNEIKLATAAYSFVSELPVSDYQMRVGVMTFSNKIMDVIDLTGNKDELLNEITSLSLTQAEGGTEINDAANDAINFLDNKRNVLKIIIVISDGEIWDLKDAKQNIELFKQKSALNVFAVYVGYSRDGIGLQNLNELTGDPKNVEMALPNSLVEALKKLNICN